MISQKVSVRKGEVLSLVIGPRNRNHVCDLTNVQLVISEINGLDMCDLIKDVSPNIQDGNPHKDNYGNAEVWHFYQGEMAKVNDKSASL